MRPSLELGADQALRNESLDLQITQLSVGELVLIWALRMRLERGSGGPVPGFRLAFGLSGVEAALASFEGFFGVLQRHCRRDIGMHAPGCRCVGLDELIMAGVIAALQAGAPSHARIMAARLVDASVLDGLLDHALKLAAALKEQKLLLPVRTLAQDGCQQPAVH